MLVYGVYENNQIVYIGQTTYSLCDRVRGHWDTAKYADQKYPLAQAMADNGFDKYRFEVLCKCDSLEELNRAEVYYIEKYNTREKGYNFRSGGDNKLHSVETKLKISLAQEGIKNHMYGRTGANNPSSKSVINLVTGDTYHSLIECASAEEVDFSKVAEVCRGEKQGLFGMVYRYIDSDGFIEHVPHETLPRTKIVYNKTTNKIYNSLAEASVSLGYERSYLSRKIKSKKEGVKDLHINDNWLILL